MSEARMRRVDEAVRAVLSDAIATDLADPRVGFVTVTAVKTSPDLRHARVYVSVLGDKQQIEQSLAALTAAHGFLQGRLSAQLKMKHTPQLSFTFDSSVQRAMRITELLDQEPSHDG
jgi:ribosome-binding factor A